MKPLPAHIGNHYRQYEPYSSVSVLGFIFVLSLGVFVTADSAYQIDVRYISKNHQVMIMAMSLLAFLMVGSGDMRRLFRQSWLAGTGEYEVLGGA